MRRALRTVSLYTGGPFTDLCRGPHCPTPSRSAPSSSRRSPARTGAGTRKDDAARASTAPRSSRRKSSTRLERIEEASDATTASSAASSTCSSSPSTRPGSPFCTRRARRLRNELESCAGASTSRTATSSQDPDPLRRHLWKSPGTGTSTGTTCTSTDGRGARRCPQAHELPGPHPDLPESSARYRDLPMRYCRAGLLHRHEPTGVLHGLMRVRRFTQDDAHISDRRSRSRTRSSADTASAATLYDAVRPRVPRSSSPRGPKARSAATRCGTRPRPRSRGARRRGLDLRDQRRRRRVLRPEDRLPLTDSIGRNWQLGTIQLD